LLFFNFVFFYFQILNASIADSVSLSTSAAIATADALSYIAESIEFTADTAAYFTSVLATASAAKM